MVDQPILARRELLPFHGSGAPANRPAARDGYRVPCGLWRAGNRAVSCARDTGQNCECVWFRVHDVPAVFLKLSWCSRSGLAELRSLAGSLCVLALCFLSFLSSHSEDALSLKRYLRNKRRHIAIAK